LGKYDPTLDLTHYNPPTLDLLKVYGTDNETQIDMVEQNANKNRIITTLQNYGIEIETIKATVGPTITLYEIVPKAGVRISKIRNLEYDIMLSLAATGIRIIAPIPGKGTIGIEVPNSDPQVVSMHSIIASKKFQESKFELPVAFGRTITNEIFMVDLAKMPHLLVAGATGQGKSVGLNAIITSLLYKKHPSQLKLVLVDPKKVEFNIYGDIEKHFLAKLPDGDDAIITDTSKVVETLNSLCKEMDDRYDLLKKAHVRNIKEYNEKFTNRHLNPDKGHRFLPYIVVIVDEFGDLIMTAGKEVEMPIARIAQLARAVGIHMIIATQRPSVNIITGVIKANFPARVAFRVSSMIDSRTILDSPGANQLVGRGDMLFSQGNDLIRVQCAFVDTPEVENIVHHISKQQAYPTAFYLPEYVRPDGDGIDSGSVDMTKRDPLFEEAAHLIVANQQGSTSLIQRKFSIGYNRAGRIVDQLEVAGIIGPFEGSKARQVLVLDSNHLDQILHRL
jgi:S-DNA-T family DNA segregation ATPase FtsK/SpoIIIE